MLSHEFIQAAANMLAAFGNNEQQPADITVSGRLHRVEPDLDAMSLFLFSVYA